MARYHVFDFYNGLPPWAKGVVIVGGGLVLYMGTKAIINSVNAAKDKKARMKSVDEIAGELTDLNKRGIVQNYSPSQFSAWADQIVVQFNGCDWSAGVGGVLLTSSGKLIYDLVSKFKNDADFAALVKAYGVREYDTCSPRVWPFNGKFSGNLYEAVQDELSVNEIASINKTLKNIGISYQF